MKTIYYFLITLLIFAILALAFTNRTNQKRSILIQSSDINISSVLLSQSADIISQRLKDFSTGEFNVSIIQKKKQIRVTFTNAWDLQTVENLIIHKGTIGFYETYNHDSLAELLSGDNRLFTLLTKSEIDNSGAKIGCASEEDIIMVTDYLNTLGLDQKCKFAWTQNFDKSNICLYALKIYGEDSPVITGNDIESSKYEKEKIQIKLKDYAVSLWSDATKRNQNKVIALVLDDNVISAPKVMTVIDSGEIEISGNFTQTQIGYIASLLNNVSLPVSFVVVK